jgi:hypothetical protein
MYFDNIGSTNICPKIKAIQQRVVTDLKAAPVVVYEYAEPGKILFKVQ